MLRLVRGNKNKIIITHVVNYFFKKLPVNREIFNSQSSPSFSLVSSLSPCLPLKCTISSALLFVSSTILTFPKGAAFFLCLLPSQWCTCGFSSSASKTCSYLFFCHFQEWIQSSSFPILPILMIFSATSTSFSTSCFASRYLGSYCLSSHLSNLHTSCVSLHLILQLPFLFHWHFLAFCLFLLFSCCSSFSSLFCSCLILSNLWAD